VQAVRVPESPLDGIRSGLAADREALRAAVDRVPPLLRRERPSDGRWSVAEILEHLAIVEGRSASALAAQVAAAPVLSEPATPTTASRLRRSTLDRAHRVAAVESFTPSGTVDADAAWTALQASRHQLLAILDAAEGRDLSTIVRQHPALGPMDGYQWFAMIGAHEARHTQQILEIADEFAAR
jgi:hypothetical protein